MMLLDIKKLAPLTGDIVVLTYPAPPARTSLMEYQASLRRTLDDIRKTLPPGAKTVALQDGFDLRVLSDTELATLGLKRL